MQVVKGLIFTVILLNNPISYGGPLTLQKVRGATIICRGDIHRPFPDRDLFKEEWRSLGEEVCEGKCGPGKRTVQGRPVNVCGVATIRYSANVRHYAPDYICFDGSHHPQREACSGICASEG